MQPKTQINSQSLKKMFYNDLPGSSFFWPVAGIPFRMWRGVGGGMLSTQMGGSSPHLEVSASHHCCCCCCCPYSFWMEIEALALVDIFLFHWTTLICDDEYGRDANMAARHLRKLRNTISSFFSLRNLVRFVMIEKNGLQKALETPLLCKVSHPSFCTNLKNQKGISLPISWTCCFLFLFFSNRV
jgi:hypothetical protein